MKGFNLGQSLGKSTYIPCNINIRKSNTESAKFLHLTLTLMSNTLGIISVEEILLIELTRTCDCLYNTFGYFA